MRYFISFGEKYFTDSEGWKGALRAVFTMFVFSKSTISECDLNIRASTLRFSTILILICSGMELYIGEGKFVFIVD